MAATEHLLAVAARARLGADPLRMLFDEVAGNHRINRVLHIMAVVQLRHDTEGRAYYRQKLAAGKTSMEAMRCLKRRLSDIVYRQMSHDARRLAAGPGGQVGATPDSGAADLIPTASTLDQSLPEPTNPEDKPAAPSTP